MVQQQPFAACMAHKCRDLPSDSRKLKEMEDPEQLKKRAVLAGVQRNPWVSLPWKNFEALHTGRTQE